jgi:hypothetical protein
MKFQPTILLTADVYEGLRSGRIRLQCGQWIRIPGDPPGIKSKPSRFISARPGWLNIVHPNGPHATGVVSMDKFKARAKLPRT